MSRLTRDGTAETVSRDQILRRVRGHGSIYFPCSADHEQDWQLYPVGPYSAICDYHTYIHIHTKRPGFLATHNSRRFNAKRKTFLRGKSTAFSCEGFVSKRNTPGSQLRITLMGFVAQRTTHSSFFMGPERRATLLLRRQRSSSHCPQSFCRKKRTHYYYRRSRPVLGI